MKQEEATWAEVTTDLFKFEEPGQEIVGTFVSRRIADSLNDRENFIYGVETAPGKIVSFFGTQQLNGRLAGVSIGATVRIVFDHEEAPTKKGHSPMKFFRVFIKDK